MADPQHGHVFFIDRDEQYVTVDCGDVSYRLVVPAPGQTSTQPCEECGTMITLTGRPRPDEAVGE